MEKNNILVSILVPAYNVEKYLPQCLDSIVNQTYQHLQVVVVDDGSKDNTLSIAQEYAAKYSFVEVYHQENAGVATARNNLLSHVKGDYVLFVDSDDWIELDMVEFLISKATENNADVIMCGNVINNTMVSDDYTEKLMSRDDCVRGFLYHKELRGSLCNKLVKTNLLYKLKFDNNISYGEDALFCWYFFQNAHTIISTTKQLYHYRMVENSLCHSNFSKKKFSGHYVWEKICEETSVKWPQYIVIAQARHCVEDVLLLRNAAHCGYNNKKEIIMLQQTIKRLRYALWKVNVTSFKMKLYAFLASYSYWFAGKI